MLAVDEELRSLVAIKAQKPEAELLIHTGLRFFDPTLSSRSYQKLKVILLGKQEAAKSKDRSHRIRAVVADKTQLEQVWWKKTRALLTAKSDLFRPSSDSLIRFR